MSYASDRINKIAFKNDSHIYLEIGLGHGETFMDVLMPHKSGVDVKIKFSQLSDEEKQIFLFEMPSDEYFGNMPQHISLYYKTPIKFDIIYIDGMHTFSQAMKDFVNSLNFSHDHTVWIFDDTIPSDPYSSLTDVELTKLCRKAAGIYSSAWHGDVYKCIFAIHDFYPDFSYATIIDKSNPQTVVWKTHSTAKRSRIKNSFSEIDSLNYFDLLKLRKFMYIIYDEILFDKLGQTINDIEINENDEVPIASLVNPYIPLKKGNNL